MSESTSFSETETSPSSSSPIRVCVVGAAGRMGQEVLRAVGAASDLKIVSAIDREHVGVSLRELGGPRCPDLPVTEKLGAALDATPTDVIVDFTHPSSAAQHALSAIKRGVAPVIGTTGMQDADLRQIREQCEAQATPALYAPNFAIGAVLMIKFAAMAARWLPDVEIIELHHEKKADAPSGTAMLTAQRIHDARTGTPARKPQATLKAEGALGATVQGIPVHSVRLPGLVAHQEVLFGGQDETLTIRHDSLHRSSFMGGVVLAVRKVRSLDGLQIGLDKILFADQA